MGKIFLFTANCENDTKRDFSLDDKKIELQGEFWVSKSQNYSATYHPEKLVYTGATVGGVHTGGIHKEEAYVSSSGSYNGRGYIEHFYYDTTNTKKRVDSITLSDKLLKEAKKISAIADMIEGNVLLLKKPFSHEQMNVLQGAVSNYNAFSQVNIANMSTSMHLPYWKCVEAAKFLNKAILGEYNLEAKEISEQLKQKKEIRDRKNKVGNFFGCLILLLPVLLVLALIISWFI